MVDNLIIAAMVISGAMAYGAMAAMLWELLNLNVLIQKIKNFFYKKVDEM